MSHVACDCRHPHMCSCAVTAMQVCKLEKAPCKQTGPRGQGMGYSEQIFSPMQLMQQAVAAGAHKLLAVAAPPHAPAASAPAGASLRRLPHPAPSAAPLQAPATLSASCSCRSSRAQLAPAVVVVMRAALNAACWAAAGSVCQRWMMSCQCDHGLEGGGSLACSAGRHAYVWYGAGKTSRRIFVSRAGVLHTAGSAQGPCSSSRCRDSAQA